MSNENNNNSNSSDRRQELIKSFLDEVERKLPFWLKDQKEDINDILEELETHIWDRATELAEGGEPSEEQIELVIEQMGSPSKIAGEYKINNARNNTCLITLIKKDPKRDFTLSSLRVDLRLEKNCASKINGDSGINKMLNNTTSKLRTE